MWPSGDLGDLSSSALLCLALLAASALGHVLLPLLPEHHRSRDTLDTVKLVSSLLVTFAALVLGLLTASVNSAFFTTGNDVNALAGALSQADGCLRSYGPETGDVRAILRSYAAGVIASTWPEEPRPTGPYPKDEGASANFESLPLGSLLQQGRLGILSLKPPDRLHEELRSICSEDFAKILTDRWRLIGEAHSSISVPFYRVLALMLTMVFVSFGLIAPRNPLSWTTIGLAAFTIGASLFVVLELDGPLDGLIKISSSSMRAALVNLDR